MLLTRVALKRFGMLDQQEYEFSSGLNLVKGPNEAGKTTLQEAILFALLGNPRHKTLEHTKRVEGRIAWRQERPFSVTIEFVDDSGTLYQLRKDWDAGTVCLTNLGTGESQHDIGVVQHIIREMLGCGSLKLLQSTICVEQDDIAEISTGQREIGDQLQSIVTGGDAEEATVTTVLSDLGKAIAEMERGWRTHAPTNPGPIKVKQDEVDDMAARLSDMRPQVERVEEAKEQLLILKVELAKIDGELGPMRSLQRLCDRSTEWQERRDTWKAKEEELEQKIEQMEDAQREIDQANEALGAYPGFEAADAQTEHKLARLQREAELLAEDIGKRSAALGQLRAQQAAEPPVRVGPPRAALLGAAAGIVSLLIGLALGVAGSSTAGTLFGLFGLLLGIGCLAWLGVSLRRPPAPDLASQIATLEADLEQLRCRQQDTATELTEGLIPFECRTWQEFEDRLNDYKQLVNQRQTAHTRREALLGGHELDTLVEERRTVSRNRRDAAEALSQPDVQQAAKVTPVEYEQLKHSIKQLEAEEAEKRQEQVRHQTRRDDASRSIEDIHRLEEQQAAAERSLGALKERLAVCQLAREVMRLAKEQTMRSARDELEPRIAVYLSRITLGRYDKVEVDDALNLRVFSQEKGDWTTPAELSRGTVDQLYLAVRLALLDLLYRDSSPPLLLDDPFVKFDPDRRKQAIALCKEIAQDHQVLLFTCHDYYDKAGDWIVELVSP